MLNDYDETGDTVNIDQNGEDTRRSSDIASNLQPIMESVDQEMHETPKEGTPAPLTKRPRNVTDMGEPKHFEENKKAVALMTARNEAEKNFNRQGGIVYVQDDIWSPMRRHATGCHLFVGLPIAEQSILKDKNATEESGTRRLTLLANDGPSCSSSQDHMGAKEYITKQLPVRCRIMSRVLTEELTSIGLDMGLDHIAPFRTIVCYEDKIRQALKTQEEKFAELSRNSSSHFAVTTTDYRLPIQYTYGLDEIYKGEPYKYLDDVDRSRALLDGFRALVQFLDTDLRELIAAVRHLPLGPEGNNIPEVSFLNLWFLFVPGQEIICPYPKPHVYRVLQVTGGRRSYVTTWKDADKVHANPTVSDLTVDCFSLDFDGKKLKAKPQIFSIRPYDGVMSVTDLHLYPLSYADPGIQQQLINRGRKFEELTTVSHRAYKGFSIKEGDRFDVHEEVHSDIMVDFQLAFLNAEARIPLPEFGGSIIETATKEPQAQTTYDGILYDDDEFYVNRRSSFIHSTELLRDQMPRNLTRDSLILLPTRVYAYVLLNRKWLPLDIDLVEEVPVINPGVNDGFQKLVLPDGHRDIVRALVNVHASRVVDGGATREVDIVKGKGKGLTILLHGAPGVGKTSTAECVAANAGRPLLSITCGDLGGANAKEVEQNLENFFDLARKWGCVLLLDEADVFLSARDKGDIRQASLVSVFLRVLEYYTGILILTTNRVGSFDEAIKSRVHCALYYPPLDKDQSLKIWKMNLKSLEERNKDSDQAQRIQFDADDIKDFAKKHWKRSTETTRWNGRQIKNAFQTAIALARWENYQHTGGNPQSNGPILRRRNFETVAKASAHFDEYLCKIRGTDQTLAKQRETRRDDYRYEPSQRFSSGENDSKRKSKKSKSKGRVSSEATSSDDATSSERTDEESSEADDTGSELEGEEEQDNRPITPPPTERKKKTGKKKAY